MHRMPALHIVAKALLMLVSYREREAAGDAEVAAEIASIREDLYLRGVEL